MKPETTLTERNEYIWLVCIIPVILDKTKDVIFEINLN